MLMDYEALYFQAFHEINHYLADNGVVHLLRTETQYAKGILTKECQAQPLHSDCLPQAKVQPAYSFTGNLSLLGMTGDFNFLFAPGSHQFRRECYLSEFTVRKIFNRFKLIFLFYVKVKVRSKK